MYRVEMKAGLFQLQSLKNVMTQELTQSIALLQYTADELLNFLESKVVENPILSVEGSSPVWKERSRKKSGESYSKKDWLEQVSKEFITLESHLLSQIHPAILDKKPLIQIIRNLDSNGYLQHSLEELVTPTISISLERLKESLALIQQLEPYGIGARNLQECLYIQAKLSKASPLVQTVLQEYFIEFAEKRWKELARKLNVSLTDIQDVFDQIQSYNPRPAAQFHSEEPTYIIPDVVVEIHQQQVVVREVDGGFPTITVDQTYMNRMKEYEDANVRKFIQDKFQEYQWITRGLQQRKETILKVMYTIAEKQRDCFFYGLDYLKPLKLKDVAEELGIHESTVSRAVKGKYVQTPFGTHEMRIFFSSSLSSAENDEDISGTKAKKILAQIIKEENKSKPYTDDQLVAILKERGLLLARRTVAKYREQLKIPSSTKRKRYDKE